MSQVKPRGVVRHLVDSQPRSYDVGTDGAMTISLCDGGAWHRSVHLIARRTPAGVDWIPDVAVTPDPAVPGGTVVSSAELLPDPSATSAPVGIPGSLRPQNRAIESQADSYLPTTAAEAASAPGNPCTQTDYVPWPNHLPWVSRTEGYRTRDSSFPYDSFRSAAIAGLNAWRDTYNNCGFNDITNLNPSLLGSTSYTYHTVSDNTSVVDIGNIGNTGCVAKSGYIVLGCTSAFNDASGHIHEFDTRFTDRSSTFATTGPADRVDLQSVATHEAGHAIGLTHADGNALTMYWKARSGDLGPRTLGKGDINGMRALYP